MWSASDRDVAAEKCRQQTGRCSQRSTEPLGCWRWKAGGKSSTWCHEGPLPLYRGMHHQRGWRKKTMMSIFRSYRGPMGVKAIPCPRRILQELGSTQNFDPSFFSSVASCWSPGYLKPERFLEMSPDWLLHGAGGSNPPETLSTLIPPCRSEAPRQRCAFRDRVKHWKFLCCNLNSMVHL